MKKKGKWKKQNSHKLQNYIKKEKVQMYGLRSNSYNTQPFLESHHPYKQVMITSSEPKMHIQIHTHIYQK